VFGISIIIYLGDWFGMSTISPIVNYSIIGYLILSLLMNVYFVNINFEKEKIALP
jgi:hypothetical protein